MKIIKIDSEETFHRTRKGRIGSSDIAAICGLNPWRTPLKVFLEMTGKIEREPENEAMWLGKELEPTVAKMFAKRHPEIELEDPKSMWVDGWKVASPDRLYKTAESESEYILECKTSGISMAKKWHEGIPDAVQCQVQWQLGVTGFQQGIVAALVAGRDFLEYPITFDASVFTQLVELGEKFMERVKSDTPPEPQAEDSEVVKKLFTLEEGLEIPLGGEAESKAEMLIAARARCAEAESEKRELETWLRFAMGKAQIGVGNKHRVKLSKVHKEPYTTKAQDYTTLKVETI